MRAVVVDASVLVAALMADGRARHVLLHASDVAFYGPAALFEETLRHVPRISKRAGLPETVVRALIADVQKRIRLVPEAAVGRAL
ncbi:MAG: PIN domain-containing protein, partial [Methanobacteriota archaeon]